MPAAAYACWALCRLSAQIHRRPLPQGTAVGWSSSNVSLYTDFVMFPNGAAGPVIEAAAEFFITFGTASV